mmetsp:Transcript_17285/g.43943  ORF Transcript_17285/g.43943 Transcript_17285/m.43943 type:complete len:230 (-) Transcript_17285:725-1414(-)
MTRRLPVPLLISEGTVIKLHCGIYALSTCLVLDEPLGRVLPCLVCRVEVVLARPLLHGRARHVAVHALPTELAHYKAGRCELPTLVLRVWRVRGLAMVHDDTFAIGRHRRASDVHAQLVPPIPEKKSGCMVRVPGKQPFWRAPFEFHKPVVHEAILATLEIPVQARSKKFCLGATKRMTDNGDGRTTVDLPVDGLTVIDAADHAVQFSTKSLVCLTESAETRWRKIKIG